MFLIILLAVLAVLLIAVIGLSEGIGTRLPWRIWRFGWTPRRVHYFPGVLLLEGDNRWRHIVAGLHVRTDRTGGATNDSYRFSRCRH